MRLSPCEPKATSGGPAEVEACDQEVLRFSRRNTRARGEHEPAIRHHFHVGEVGGQPTGRFDVARTAGTVTEIETQILFESNHANRGILAIEHVPGDEHLPGDRISGQAHHRPDARSRPEPDAGFECAGRGPAIDRSTVGRAVLTDDGDENAAGRFDQYVGGPIVVGEPESERTAPKARIDGSIAVQPYDRNVAARYRLLS